MNAQNNTPKPTTSRRDFLKATSGVLTGAALAGAIGTRAYAGESNTIKIALVGCGGRGTGAAANALSTKGPTKLFAMADVFEQRLESSLSNLAKSFGKQINVSGGRKFLGMGGYKKAIDAIAPGGLVILATPPASPSMPREFAACSRRVRLPRQRTSRSPAA